MKLLHVSGPMAALVRFDSQYQGRWRFLGYRGRVLHCGTSHPQQIGLGKCHPGLSPARPGPWFSLRPKLWELNRGMKNKHVTVWSSLQLNIHLAATSKWNLSEQCHHLAGPGNLFFFYNENYYNITPALVWTITGTKLTSNTCLVGYLYCNYNMS